MAQNISLLGADYPDVPAVVLPKTGGGTARFDDVTDTTATASGVLNGLKFHLADGSVGTGNIASKTSSDLAFSGTTFTAPAGHYASAATKTITGVTIAKPASGTSSFSITVPNGNSTITYVFTVDSYGGVAVTDS